MNGDRTLYARRAESDVRGALHRRTLLLSSANRFPFILPVAPSKATPRSAAVQMKWPRSSASFVLPAANAVEAAQVAPPHGTSLACTYLMVGYF